MNAGLDTGSREENASRYRFSKRDLALDSDRLQKLAAASRLRDEFTIEALAKRLQKLGGALENSSHQ